MAQVEVGQEVDFYSIWAMEPLVGKVTAVSGDGKVSVVGDGFTADNVRVLDAGEGCLNTQYARARGTPDSRLNTLDGVVDRVALEEAKVALAEAEAKKPGIEAQQAVAQEAWKAEKALSETSKAAKEASEEEGAQFKAL